VREVPEVAVAGVGVFLRRRDRDAARGGEVDGVLARDDLPLPPRRDDGQLRREGLVGELEADLVVPLAGAAVRKRVASGLEGDLDLLAGDERPRRRRAEEVVLLVDRAGLQHREEVVGGEFFFGVDEMEVTRAGGVGLLLEAARFLGLPDVDGDRDDFAAVVFLQPGDDHRGVQAA
jgi:hypothetical protein